MWFLRIITVSVPAQKEQVMVQVCNGCYQILFFSLLLANAMLSGKTIHAQKYSSPSSLWGMYT